jgi:pimeloyl-ACP methyl ester carboxylesterase
MKSRLGRYATKEQFALSLEALSQVAPHVFARRIREIIRVDVAPELLACDIPILYLQGERDRVVPAANLRRILRIKPTIRSIAIRTSHMILKTRPEESVKAIAQFYARLGFLNL